MILLLSSLGCDVQTQLLKNELTRRGMKVLVIHTHKLHKQNISVILSLKGETVFSINKHSIIIEKIIFTTNPRTDAILYPPSSIDYPIEWRYRVGSFIKEFFDLFEEKCYPGTFLVTQKGESKMKVMQSASYAGLNIPTFSEISFENKKKDRFIKPLGFPFIISNKKNSPEEICVTSFGGMAEKSDNINYYPSISQTPISAHFHVRCFATTEKIFSSARKVLKSEVLVDFRQLNEQDDFNPKWSNITLSEKTQKSLKRLLQQFNLKWASPEFLVTKEGKEIFIDLNPCGDWYGFFTKKTRREIVKHIADIVL